MCCLVLLFCDYLLVCVWLRAACLCLLVVVCADRCFLDILSWCFVNSVGLREFYCMILFVSFALTFRVSLVCLYCMVYFLLCGYICVVLFVVLLLLLVVTPVVLFGVHCVFWFNC